MTCERIQDLLPDAAAGQLPASQHEAVQAHLAGCSECRAEYDVVMALSAAGPQPPAGLEARVLRATRRRGVRRWGSPGQLAAAATLAAAVIGGTLFFEGRPQRAESAAGTSSESPAPDAILPALDDPALRGSLLAELTEAELLALLEKMES